MVVATISRTGEIYGRMQLKQLLSGSWREKKSGYLMIKAKIRTGRRIG